MPIPILGLPAAITAVLNARNLYIVAGAYAVFRDQINAAVYQVLEGDGVAGWITEKINEKLTASGVDLQFRNVFDFPKTKEDVDKFAAARVNAKAGTNFQGLAALTRDDFLSEVGKKIAGQINTATGSNITSVYPVATLRDELGTELSRQFDPGVDLGNGALFPRDKLVRIEQRVYARFAAQHPTPVGNYWGPAPTPEAAAKRAKGRARQAKYRRTHKLAWISKA